jgi:uncharacterized protein
LIKDIEYKGPQEKTKVTTKEGKVLQDADRLEALGAIGIARCFATGSQLGQEIHNPNNPPILDQTEEEFKKQYTGERKNTTINHFYEKILKVKDLMNTETGKKIAEKRHKYVQEFLDRFFKECEGKE